MKRLIVLVFLCSLSTPLSSVFAQCTGITTISQCPDEGCTNSGTNDEMLNVLKNRTDAATNAASKTLQSIRNLDEPESWELGADRTELQNHEGKAIRLTAYLIQLLNTPSGNARKNPISEGAESCNCKLTGSANIDWHCVLGSKKTQAEGRSVTAEVTPRIRKNHPHWTITKLRNASRDGKRVRFTGWLMLDTHHVNSPITRSTNWELHPVTKIEVETTHNHWVNLDNQ